MKKEMGFQSVRAKHRVFNSIIKCREGKMTTWYFIIHQNILRFIISMFMSYPSSEIWRGLKRVREKEQESKRVSTSRKLP